MGQTEALPSFNKFYWKGEKCKLRRKAEPESVPEWFSLTQIDFLFVREPEELFEKGIFQL